MKLECPQCKSPIAREGQRFCYRCGQDLNAYYNSQGVELKEGLAAPAPAAPTPAAPAASDAAAPPERTEPEAKALPEKAEPPAQTMVIDPKDLLANAGKAASPSERKAMLRVLLPTGDIFDRDISQGETQMGKGPRNDIVIADPAVSAAHASIRAEEGSYILTDLGSRNGTFVNGERISEPRKLSHGDVVGIGLSKLTFRLSDNVETDGIQKTEVLSIPKRPVPPPLTEASLAQAIISEGLVPKAEVERLSGKDARGRRLYRAIVDERAATEESLRDLMSRTFQIPTVDLRRAQIDEAIAADFSSKLARTHQVFPISQEGGRLLLAVADPTDTAAAENVKSAMHLPVDFRLATASEIAEMVDQHYGPKLIGVLPSGEKLEYLITQNDTEIGKAVHNHIVLTDPTVSNTHAILLAREGGYQIVDLGSRNGTFVNGERLTTHAVTLRHGDAIQLGQTVFTFRNPSETAENVTTTLSSEALEEIRRRAGLGNVGAPKSASTTAESLAQQSGKSSKVAPGSAVVIPLGANATPASVSPASPLAPAQDTPADGLLTEADDDAKEEKKKKKKKKKEDDRLKAAYVGAVSRIVAQVLAVLVSVGAAIYITTRPSSTPSNQGSGGSATSGGAGAAAGSRFVPGAIATIPGKLEPSGVIYAPESRGVLIVSDNKPAEVFWMELDPAGNRVGELAPVSLGDKKAVNPEAITYGASYYYVVGAQADPAVGDENSLVRFAFDPQTRTLQGEAESIVNLRRFLLENVPELKGEGEKPGAQGGLNIEGIAWDPKNERLLLGLRSPLPNNQALIVPIKLPGPGKPFAAENLTLADPRTIQLNLGGHGIRDITYDKRLNAFLIISGVPEPLTKADFKLWEWSGDTNPPAAAAKLREDLLLDPDMKPEGITRMDIPGRDFVIVVGDASRFVKLDYRPNQ